MKAATYIRNITYCVILIRGSLSLGFKGVIPVMIMISIVPSIVEALVVAAVSRNIFNMSTSFSYTMGYMLGSVGAGVTLPSIFLLIMRGVKMRAHIHSLLVMGCLFENLISGTVFTIFRNEVEAEYLSEQTPVPHISSSNEIIAKAVTNLCISIATGIAGGVIMFLLFLLPFFLTTRSEKRQLAYLLFFLLAAIGVPIISE